MSLTNISCFLTCSLSLFGIWMGIKYISRKISYHASRNAAQRFNMRDSGLRIRLENCPGEYCLLDLSSSGMAIFIDHFADGFSLAKHTKFILRNSHGEFPTKMVGGKVVYLKQLSHGYRLGVQFDKAIEDETVQIFRKSQETLMETEIQEESDIRLAA
ncbi:MAG: hypothetical protein COW01_05375 [Bdellovibrionales bacterium CG12_big_fil_rev_8_21_14_0_65_38_15]|nr:MAG: hypothetical protein COW79_00865 [Bdellovibrionales bacterium CG22_combo_CG10-13_8_21_14_all_38_13]PIQ56180.1 MAG: hypothetical protein COW01_05375 [Bdellovibrionales bacterium CG12_big_fil_rev_8_21_14_0_65_38_15]PIR28803.1 MAG: hypothetical protein COV38_13940 [Bdellovibrionales bacterium CG11_big_fil_rev_8_21_14_0_20_38_13]